MKYKPPWSQSSHLDNASPCLLLDASGKRYVARSSVLLSLLLTSIAVVPMLLHEVASTLNVCAHWYRPINMSLVAHNAVSQYVMSSERYAFGEI